MSYHPYTGYEMLPFPLDSPFLFFRIRFLLPIHLSNHDFFVFWSSDLLIFWSSDLLIFWSSFRYSCHLMFLISLSRLNKNSQVLPPKLSGNPIHLMNHSYRMKFMFFWCSFFHSSNEDFSSPSLKMGCWCFEVRDRKSVV